ncbi:hypothetical protein F4776DRAFT_574114 [Hypoxylon sp. NC0597]|nr:hypothetical protein F4776DRAFT_574114 [Hypoxylon sp. NC0597]
MLASKIFPIGIGTDICQISRIYKNLTSGTGVKFIHRILTPEEYKTPQATNVLRCVYMLQDNVVIKRPFDNLDDPRDPAILKAAQFIAGRFAAKEAAMKAYSIRRVFFRDIVITYERHLTKEPGDENSSTSPQERQESISPDLSPGNSFQPAFQSSPPVAIIKGDDTHEDVYARVSISHDGDYAVAMCLVYLKDPASLPNLDARAEGS